VTTSLVLASYAPKPLTAPATARKEARAAERAS
jgi:hypothetical protein